MDHDPDFHNPWNSKTKRGRGGAGHIMAIVGGRWHHDQWGRPWGTEKEAGPLGRRPGLDQRLEAGSRVKDPRHLPLCQLVFVPPCLVVQRFPCGSFSFILVTAAWVLMEQLKCQRGVSLINCLVNRADKAWIQAASWRTGQGVRLLRLLQSNHKHF